MLGIGRPPLHPPSFLTAHPSYRQGGTVFPTRFFALTPYTTKYTRFIIYRTPSSCICVGAPSLVRRNFCLRARKKHDDKGKTVSEGEDSIDLDFDANDDLEGYDDIIADEEEGEDDDGDGDGEDDDDDIVLESDELDAWLSTEPRGFGVGKVYDTSVEDKLMEEIERSRKAQLSNTNELKSPAGDSNKNKADKEESNILASGLRVHISQLPKKKNIQRDLNAAFKGIPGIINITPVVSGNKKTRDPVCKGLAFVDFKSPADANRFIRVFSSQNVGFGKVMKQIKCELLMAAESSHTLSTEGFKNTNATEVSPDLEEDNLNDGSKDSAALDDEQMKRILQDLKKLEQQGSSGMELKVKPLVAQDAVSSPEDDSPTRKANKPRPAKKKTNKVTATKIPKVAKRLKPKEKSMFVDVLSRYGSGLASTAKDSR